MNRRLYIIPLTVLVVALLVGCSTTSGIPDGDQLYTGMKKTQYNAPEKSAHYDKVVEELDAALATAPNGSLFGSSTFRNPLQVGLWIWNAFANDSNAVSRWLVKSFGSRPVLMSRVNPALRASVAKEVLRQHGYMRGTVTYNVIPQRNPKKAKIAYTVNMGHLFTIDTLKYFGFPASADSLMEAHKDEALITSGSAFDVSTLDGERQRLSTLFRNNGYYYYQPSYASYVADTFSVAGKVQLHLQVADNLPPEVGRKWYIGNVDLQFRRTVMEPLTDSIQRYNRRTGKARPYIFRFNGKRMPISPRVVMSEMRFRPGQLYNYANYQETANLFSSTGLFSMVDFKFTPRDTTATCDTLDVAVNCVFQKPYDFYISANLTGKSNNYFGPGAEIGLTKRNAFRGGETLDLSAYGSYEWQTGHNADGSSGHLNSYEYGFSASVEFPRLVMPWAPRFRRHRRNYATPSTTLKISSDVVNRAKYFKRHIVSAKWMYTYQPTATVRHQFSPLTLSYEYTVNSSATYDSIVAANPYLLMTMQDQFIPNAFHPQKPLLAGLRLAALLARDGGHIGLPHIGRPHQIGDKMPDLESGGVRIGEDDKAPGAGRLLEQILPGFVLEDGKPVGGQDHGIHQIGQPGGVIAALHNHGGTNGQFHARLPELLYSPSSHRAFCSKRSGGRRLPFRSVSSFCSTRRLCSSRVRS